MDVADGDAERRGRGLVGFIPRDADASGDATVDEATSRRRRRARASAERDEVDVAEGGDAEALGGEGSWGSFLRADASDDATVDDDFAEAEAEAEAEEARDDADDVDAGEAHVRDDEVRESARGVDGEVVAPGDDEFAGARVGAAPAGRDEDLAERDEGEDVRPAGAEPEADAPQESAPEGAAEAAYEGAQAPDGDETTGAAGPSEVDGGGDPRESDE
ncbi:MAG: hypothetical protein R3A79_19065 [Nannocystaceae bacterium]